MNITEQRDRISGFVRLEVNTTRMDKCQALLEKSGCIRCRTEGEGSISYGIDFKGVFLKAMATPTRLVLWGENALAMHEFLHLIEGSEKDGTAWAYDDSKRTDYENSK